MSESFLSPTSVDVEVETQGGKKRTFRCYPMSVRVAFQLQAVAQPLVKAFYAFLGDPAKQECELVQGEQGTIVRASHPELVRIKLAERAAALEALQHAFSQRGNQILLAFLVMDSLRDEAYPRPATQPHAEAFFEQFDVATLMQVLVGVVSANGKSFGPLGLRLVSAVMAEAGLNRKDEPIQTAAGKS